MGGFTASVPQFVDVPGCPDKGAAQDADSKDQKRSTMACVHCRRRKMRCVKQDESACVACARLGKSCKFVPISEAENLKARQKKRDSRMRKARMESQSSTVSSNSTGQSPLQWPQAEASRTPRSAKFPRFEGTRRASLDRAEDSERVHTTRKRGATVSGADLTRCHEKAVPLSVNDDDDDGDDGDDEESHISSNGSMGLDAAFISDNGMKTERSLDPHSLTQPLLSAGNLGDDLPAWAQTTFASSQYFTPWNTNFGNSGTGLDATALKHYQNISGQSLDASATQQQEPGDAAIGSYSSLSGSLATGDDSNVKLEPRQDSLGYEASQSQSYLPNLSLNISPALSPASMAGIEARPATSQSVNGNWDMRSMASSVDTMPSGLAGPAPPMGLPFSASSGSGCDDAVSPVLLAASVPTTAAAALLSTQQAFPASTISPPSTSSSAGSWGASSFQSQGSSDASSLATDSTGWFKGSGSQTALPLDNDMSRSGSSYMNTGVDTDLFKPSSSMQSLASTAPPTAFHGNSTSYAGQNLWRMPSGNDGSAAPLSTNFAEDTSSMSDSHGYSQFCHQSPSQLDHGLQQLLTRGY